ncbi:MAG: tetratricopeptide repeat protein, partial [Pirellulales bacterium]|nr:tetratricopeptide repeat protein [Pirellulales bacterium]
MSRRILALLAFLFLVVSGLMGVGLFGGAARGEDNENPALKYHAILAKRPEPGYLFDRFYNAWLDRGTVESLQEFLQSRVDREDTTANRLLLAFFHAKQNNDVAAIDEFAKALATGRAGADVWYHKALAEARTLDFEAAIADLKKARDQKPDAKLAVRIDRQLGTMLLRNHETEAAIGVWKSLLAANPSDEELCEDVIELHIEEGLFKEAAVLSESLIARTKDPYLAVTRRLRLGDIYDRSGQRTKAVEIYTSTLEQAGQDSWLEREILAQIEQLFRREDDLSGLKKQYASLLETYPKRIGLQRRRCRLLVELGDHDEAIQGYNKILELTPGDRGIREEYVGVLSQIGRHEPAVKQLESLCEQNPGDAELRVRLAKTLHAAKRPAEAIEAVRQYLKTSDQSEYAHLRAARLVESSGDKTEAAAFYRALADKFADSPSAQEALAVFLYANNQKKDALAIWRKLAQGADVKGILNVARALGSRGEDAAAFELLSGRQKDFGDEPLFLGQLVATALRQKQFEQALPWARRRVELATSVTELEAAVAQAAAACEQSDKLGPMIAELDALDNRPIALTCLLAELLECDGRSRRADQLLSEPAASGEWLAVGQQIRLFSLRREWAQAAEATRRMLELAGGHKSLHVRRLVELYEQDYQIDEALKWVETWKRLSPGATTPWLAQARLLELQGDQDAAQEALRNAVQRFDKDEDLRARLAQSYQSAGKVRDAERVYWQLYEKSGDVGDRLRWAAELAKLAEREGTIARLVENFQQRHRGNRRSIVPLLALAEVHRVAGNYEGRRQALMAATQVKPDDLQLLTHLARIDESEGNWKEAVATLERAARLDKTNQTRQKIARLHLEYGDIDQGYAMLRELMGDRTADPRALEHMADALCGMTEWDRAIELLRNRMAHHPGDYRLRFLLAVAYEESGRTDEAIAQFVELLDNQEELAQDKKKTAQNTYASHIDIIRRLVPAETMEWFEISQYRHSVYQYRQRGSGMAYLTTSVGMPSTTISLPPSVEIVRPYAMVHLVTLARELDESRVAAFSAAMKNHGVRNPKLLLKLGFETNSGLPAVAEALEEDPDNESLLAMAVFSGFAREQAVDAAPLARAFAKFRRSRPELAVMAAIQAAASDEKHAPLLDEAVGLAATIENPNPLVMMSLATSLGGQPWGRGDMPSALTEKQRAKLVKLLVDWYPRMSQGATPYGPYAFICVVGALRSSEDPSAYFNLLDDEVARWRAGGGKQGGQNPFSFGRQPNASLLEPLGFPPRELTDFPPNVSMLLMSDANNPYSQMMGLASGPAWETEKVEPLVAKVKDPTLRVLLANQYDLSKVVDATLKEMLAGRTPRLDAYLMAAGKAEADLRFGESVRLLEKARHLPMKQETRRRVDAALVAAVRSAKDNDKADEAALKAGRDAALRLRRQRLDAQQRDQLIAVLEDFGLKKEAQKLEKRTAAMGSTGGVYSSAMAVTAPLRYSKTSNSRVDKLIASGKRDAAARLLANEARSLCQQMLANSGNSQYYRRQGRALKERLAG